MNKSTTALILSLLVCPALSLVAQAQSAVNEQDARSIALDAYIYFYPLVTMDVRTNLSHCRHETGRTAQL